MKRIRTGLLKLKKELENIAYRMKAESDYMQGNERAVKKDEIKAMYQEFENDLRTVKEWLEWLSDAKAQITGAMGGTMGLQHVNYVDFIDVQKKLDSILAAIEYYIDICNELKRATNRRLVMFQIWLGS